MSQLISKSAMNIAAAHDLQKSTYYCSSIHCSYYSCVQLMLHVLLHKVGFTQQKLNDDFRNHRIANPHSPGGLHEYYINQVVVYLKARKQDFLTFNKEIFKLKQTRTTADYLDIGISMDECRFSIQRAEDINKIIQKVL